MKTSELTGAQLDYWVARAQDYKVTTYDDMRWVWIDNVSYYIGGDFVPRYAPSVDWAQGGPLIERYAGEKWDGVIGEGSDWNTIYMMHGTISKYYSIGPTPLIAICRAVVRSVFGDEVPND